MLPLGRPLALKLLIAAAAIAAYAGTLRTSEFFYDDRSLIADNPLVAQGLRAAPRLFATGYWEAVAGDRARVQEYRPVLMLTFLVQTALTGPRAAPLHAGNLLLHALVCLLLYEVLARKLGASAAGAGALLYALMPVHTEAVSLLTGRSEVLSAALLLGAWLLLDEDLPPRSTPFAGCALYALALLTKESSVLFPVFLALNDFAFRGRRPWEGESRRAQVPLWTLTAAYLVLRRLVLRSLVAGGVPYFAAGPLVRWLTVARFALRHYLWPSLSGTGLCADYRRPLIPDASPGSPAAWLCLIAIAALAAAAARSLRRRRGTWGFWVLGPSLFLLPTSHLLFPLDTLGAERFLYLPTIGLAAAGGALFARLAERRRTLAVAGAAALAGWYGAATFVRNRSWRSGLDFDRAEVACNPVSARAAAALGGDLLQRGDAAAGLAELGRASRLNPGLPAPYYNLARFEVSRGDCPQAERLLTRALAADTSSADAWTLIGLCAEKDGRLGEAARDYARALELRPEDSAALYDLGRLELATGRYAAAAARLRRFLELAPADPDAPAVRALLARLEADAAAGRISPSSASRP